MKSLYSRSLAVTLAIAMLFVGAGRGHLQAMLVPAEPLTQSEMTMDSAEDMASVRAVLEHKVVKQRLADLGIDQAEIDRRMARLSNEQLHQVAMQIEKQNPAGDAGGVVVTVLLIAVLVALFVYLVDRI